MKNPATNIISTMRAYVIDCPCLRRGVPSVFLVLALTLFSLSQTARAVTPAPDGGYANQNTAEGDNALLNLTTGNDNTANGAGALFFNTTGSLNTANGSSALYSNTTGNDNTANGFNALFSNTTANDNTATGFEALYSNTTGSDNTANGVNALLSNATGSQNTANGVGTLKQNTTGGSNTASGYRALYSNTTGLQNTATGVEALYSNTTGSANAAHGVQALTSNTTGGNNTAMGHYTLLNNTIANYNTAVGSAALEYCTGANNIAVGNQAGFNLTTGSNNIDIGNLGVAGESGKIRIGKGASGTFISGIYNKTVASGVGVIIDSTGHLGTVQSSRRYKEGIKPMDNASEAVLALKPVTFRYKEDLDQDGIPQFGLIAEEVEKVNPDLVVRDEDGKVTTVRYDAVNAMLLNEFLKEHRKVQEQAATITLMKKQIQGLAATVQKVSDQLELSKSAPQVVANDR